ncbi:hypothetical protein MYX75_02740 [Acidobacteria bacterium AH-259-A15]|nr:hypothetical protein [Acidobacteria bacterium AH-259-A15]
MTAIPLPINKNTPRFIREIVDSMFGEKEFLPFSTFMRKMGVDRKTVLKMVGDGTLDVFQYHTGTYRKLLVPKTSFIRFLKAASLRKIS